MNRILFVVDERKIGGVSILLEDYLKNISLKDKKVTVLVLHNNGDRLQNLPNGIEIKYIDNELKVVDFSLKELLKRRKYMYAFKKLLISFYIKTGYIKKYISKIRKKYKIENYDIEVGFKDGFCHLFTAFGDSKKKIAWIHNDYTLNNFIKKYDKTFYNVFEKYDNIVAISNEIKEHFNNIYNNQDKTEVINNYIDENKIKNMASEKCDLKIDKNKINMLCIGRLSYEKGYDRLLNALCKLKKEKPNINDGIFINVIGDGEEFESLNTTVKEYGLESIITFMGRDNNPYKYIPNFDMVLIPSRYEAYCLVMIEALINKVPILTTAVASVDEITNNGKYGMVMQNSEEGIYNALKEILSNKKIIDEYKENVSTYSYKEKNIEILDKVNKLLEIN